MRFGISGFATDEGIRPDTLGKAVEERGFDSLFLAEHSHIPHGSTGPDGSDLSRVYYRTLDPFVALTAAAAVTSDLLLATGVALLVQRDVLHTAKEVATLDHLSGGRVVLGVGAGWNRAEMRHHGVDPRTRGRRLDEQLAALKRVWTQDEAEFHGEFVDFDALHMWPKPTQTPHPPIYVGGNGAAARARVVAYGDGWFPTHASPDDVAGARATFTEQGRPDVIVNAPASPDDLKTLDAYAEAGLDRVTFHSELTAEADVLRRLDELARLVERYS